MKPLPPDTTVTPYEYPVYESAHDKSADHLQDIPLAEGFAPMKPNAPIPIADLLPIVQKAEFQDFAKVVPPQA